MEFEQEKIFKILMVDDNVNNLQVLGNILRENGYNCGFASNGKQALDILASSKDYDLILLDIDMPVMDGYATCKEIKKNVELRDIPVIFLTAYSDREVLIKALEQGAQDYITKPFYSKELMLRINTHLEIKYKNEQLKLWNQFLEQKVEERTKELIEANLKLASLDNAKNYFIGLLSHELKTPLIGINGNAKMIKEISTDPEIIDSCDDILASETRLRKFIELAILLTRIKAEKVDISFNFERIHDFIETSINKVKEIAEHKRIMFIKEISHPEKVIRADYSLIGNVFNFINDNAVKFSPENSKITIRDFEEKDNYKIIIQDEGNGFSEEFLEKKLEMLQAGTLLSHTEGTGLSLFASKSIMELHGFNMKLQNTPNKGAMVELIFPQRN